MASSIILDNPHNSHSPSYDGPASVKPSSSQQYSFGSSVWNLNRNIWGSNGNAGRYEEKGVQKGVSDQNGSISSVKADRRQSPSSRQTAKTPQPTHSSESPWLSTTIVPSEKKSLPLISPTKAKQTGWLFKNGDFKLEKSSLLAGSAPEYEATRNNHSRDSIGILHTSEQVLSLSQNGFSHKNAMSASANQLPIPDVSITGVRFDGQRSTAIERSEQTPATFYDHNSRQSTASTVSPTARGFGRGTNVRLPSSNGSPATVRTGGFFDANSDFNTQQWKAQMQQKEPVMSAHKSYFVGRNNSDLRHGPHQFQQGRFDSIHESNPIRNGTTFDQFEALNVDDGRLIGLDDGSLAQKSNWLPADQDPRMNHMVDWRQSLQSPYYSAAATPPTGPESIRSAGGSGISSRTSHHDIALVDRKLKSLDLYQNSSSIPPHNFIPAQGLEFQQPSLRMNPLATPYTMQGFSSYDGYAPNSRMTMREPEHVQVIRSPLLEEFRINHKTSKRYELRDIFDHIVEFSGDQHGSRFIQQKLETANSDEKDQVFREIQPNSLQLMTDVFGNYVIQKLFEHGNQSQKKSLAHQMKGHILNLSLQMYGCRVVQKALEHVLTDQQAGMVKELDGHNKHILKVIRDQNGNHVVQKAIERVPAEHIHFIVEAHKGEVVKLATHTYGCRVIQRILEHCQPAAKRIILDELHGCVAPLITDSFGNYVVQHVIQNGEPDDRRRVVAIVQQQLLIFSKHKFASNVVEKCIEFADDDQRAEIVRRLIGHNEQGQTPVLGLLRDQYGNYVIQRIHKHLKGAELEALTNEMKACFPQLKRTSYGKQVLAIEKLLYGSCFAYNSFSSNARPPAIEGMDHSASNCGNNLSHPTFEIQRPSPKQMNMQLQMTTYY